MANKHASLSALFTDIADAIREKTGDTDSILADDFPDVIRDRLQVIPPVTMISFAFYNTTIGTINCQAEEGMTWAEWVDSTYNTPGCYISNGKLYYSSYVMIKKSGVVQVPTDVIVANTTYNPAKEEK